MELFENIPNPTKNHLPHDGEVYYHGKILSEDQARNYFNALSEGIEWQHDQAVIFGKKITTKRKVAWYGNSNFSYTYSNSTKHALAWTEELLELKQLVEKSSGETFNSCLLNLYHSGEEGMAWHSDGEIDLKKNGAIASLSLGAERKFSFKHKNTKQKIDLFLADGSMLIMKGTTQSNWLHSLPKTKKVVTPRINLTFRTIVNH